MDQRGRPGSGPERRGRRDESERDGRRGDGEHRSGHEQRRRDDRPSRPARDSERPRDSQARSPGRGQPARRPASGPARPRGKDREARPILDLRGELLYGRNAVLEALRGRRRLFRLYLAEGIKQVERVRDILQAAANENVPIEEVPRLLLDDATGGTNHQGLALDAAGFEYTAIDNFARASGTILVLDHLQDPQNFGTLLRAAEAAGLAGVVIPQDRSVSVTPAVVNASAGAVEHLAIARMPNLARTLDELKERGRWVVGLAAGTRSTDLFTTEVPTPTALVVGAEGSGIGPNVLRRCDLQVALPMRGQVASLNAATAGSIALFELFRRELIAPEADASPDARRSEELAGA